MGHVRVAQRVDKFEETHETWSFGIEQTGGPLSPTHTFEKKRKVLFLSMPSISPLTMPNFGYANKGSTMHYRQIKISMYDRQNGQDEDAAK